MLFDACKERARIVQAQAHTRMLFQQLDKGEVAVLVRFLKNMVKIAAGLMGVNQQDEMETLRHEGGLILHRISYPAAQPCKIRERVAGTSHVPKLDAAAVATCANAGIGGGTQGKPGKNYKHTSGGKGNQKKKAGWQAQQKAGDRNKSIFILLFNI